MATPQRKEYYRDSIATGEEAAFPKQKVISGSDRGQYLREREGIRNAKSSMPGSPQNPNFTSSIPDTASNFRESYAKAGIQPANIDDRPPAPRSSQGEMANRTAQTEYSNQPMIRPGAKTFKLRQRQREKNPAKAAYAKARATTANLTIFAWGFWIWAFVQVPIAIFSTILFAISEAIYRFVTDLINGITTSESGILRYGAEIIGEAFGLISWLVDKVLSVFNIDLELFAPSSFYMVTVLILMVIGAVTMFLAYMVYKMAFLRPLNGRAAGFKWLMFSISFIGYGLGSMAPVLNLVPWFVFWTIAVWMYPK